MPANWPLSFSSSSFDLTLRRTPSPCTGPFVPGVQASGSASSSAWSGAVIRTAQPLVVPAAAERAPSVSRCALESPHAANCSRVHSLAAFTCGEPVSRGPIRSISSEAVSMTLELVNPSWRIFVTMSRSTCSSAGRAERRRRRQAHEAIRRFRGHLLCTEPRHGTTGHFRGSNPRSPEPPKREATAAFRYDFAPEPIRSSSRPRP